MVCCSDFSRLAAMEKELRVKESLLDTTRRRFLKHQHDQRVQQIQELDQEISKTVSIT